MNKNINNIKKIIILIIVLIIVSGIVMICVKGFNYSLLYSKTQRMNIYMTNDFNVNEIEDIAKEVLGDKEIKVQLSNTFGTVVSIVSSEISEEDRNSIVQKINERYEIEINTENDIVLTEIPQANIWDSLVKYILPLFITTLIILIYYFIRFRKQGIVNYAIIPIIRLIMVITLYISIIALTRIPVNEFFTTFLVLLYILTIIWNTINLSKKEF